MYNFYFDSGTTNTRAYLLEGTNIVCRSSMQIGSRDSAIQNDNRVLLRELRRIYTDLLTSRNLSDGDISHIYMSGMISSSNGLVELEHLSTPVNLSTLRQGVVSYLDTVFFNRVIEIIPGIKTLAHGEQASLDTVEFVNNMRGEEIEILGILHRYPQLKSGHAIIILPGSHTQVAFLTNGSIENISSNITGELYNAILSETILSSSLAGMVSEEIDPAMVQKGYHDMKTYGFNRALYIVRSMLLFTDASLLQRRSYLEGALNGGVMEAICNVLGSERALIAVSGSQAQYRIFSALGAAFFQQFEFFEVSCGNALPFSVEGLFSLTEAVPS